MRKIIVVREELKSAHAYVHRTDHYSTNKREYLSLSGILENDFPGLAPQDIEFGVIQNSVYFNQMAIVWAKVEYREQWPSGWDVQKNKPHDIYF